MTVLALLVLTPPLLVSDEPNHFYRAYQVSLGQWRGTTQDNAAGGVLPTSLARFEEVFLRARVRVLGETHTRFALSETWSFAAIPLDPAVTSFIGFTQMALYAPIGYVPPAIGIAVGRWLGGDVLHVFLLARLANALAAVALTACALWVLPVGRQAAMVVALFPMNLYQYASLSMDAVLIPGGLLYAALVIDAVWHGRWRPARLAAAIGLGALICASKIVYVPILFLAAWPAVMAWRRGDRQLAGGAAAIAIIGMVGGAGWLALVADQVLPNRPGVAPGAHVAWLLQHPMDYLEIFGRTITTQAGSWCLEVIGNPAWSKIWLPMPVYLVAILGLVCGLLADRDGTRAMRRGDAAWSLLLIAACIGLISTALFVTWSLDPRIIEGIQGRYFNPLLVAFSGAVGAFLWTPGSRVARFARVGSFVCPVVVLAGLFATLIGTLGLF